MLQEEGGCLMKRYSPTYKQGLTSEQVALRKKEGLVNVTELNNTKSYKQIIYDNIVTLFNFINLVLAILIFLTGSYRNLLFLGVALSNIVIGIFQETRAKRILDNISLIVSMKICAIRNGKECMIPVDEVVLDDILKVKSGSQIVADSIVVSGELEVDESLLTGESDIEIKKAGDFLYSGSFVVGSYGYIKVEKVGEDCYASDLIKNVKKFNKYPSELRDSLNKIIKYIGIAIIPMGIALFMKDYVFLDVSFNDAILGASAALIGMIPEGLVILTSIALAVGSINLAKHKTLVQELYCLETLARVDVLCLDKTGTITEGKMEVDKIIPIQEENFDEIIGNMISHLCDDNATFHALKERYTVCHTKKMIKTIPFNSKKKYSGVIFEEAAYFMGAYEFLKGSKNEKEAAIERKYAQEGYRVLTLVKSNKTKEEEIVNDNEVIGFILLLDKVRDSAKETLEYFMQQGVDVKVISGDHPLTVSQVSKRAGLKDYDKYVDASLLTNYDEIKEAVKKYSIFGRVTPVQKKEMIQALKEENHIVGMSGDGVNDVLAFKEADVSIAMASGSDVAKASANLVLLDCNFDALPYVLYEGRRVINNIQRVATLFLTKTIFSFFISILSLIMVSEYPFVPIHLTFVSTLTIGVPAFLMALEPNRNRVEKYFLENVLKISLPAAVSVLVCILYVYLMAIVFAFNEEIVTQLSLIVISINGVLVLWKVAYPFTLLRFIVFVVMSIGILLGLAFGGNILLFNKIYFSNIGFHIAIVTIILISISNIGSKTVNEVYKRKFRKEHV